MSDISENLPSTWSRFAKTPQWVWVLGIAGLIYGVVTYFILQAHPDYTPRFAIDFSPLMTVPMVLKVHIASALTAFGVGLWILAGPKGRGMHKKLGWVWVTAMGSTAVSSFFLTGLNGGSFSWIHGLSAWTVIGLPMGIYAISKQRNVKVHAKHMTGMFLGGMIVAGLFTFLPGRLMWTLFFTG